MKLYHRILIILSVIFIFNSAVHAAEESLEDIAKEISEVRQEISQLQSSNIKEAIIIDKALKELDQVMTFVSKSVEKGDTKGAINAINFMNRSIMDIAATVPNEYKSEKVTSSRYALRSKLIGTNLIPGIWKKYFF